ncbi:LOW QUALITY PROTEIN: DNA-binding protein RFX7-like [Uloborus diversus]|uniref:LOW QUALITY PROTEIN: DNA-binding protein RFX7-like n=1 Tax=Uloborus diversus TaxID=327109 RepID=UPI0024091C9B|nr:LOW QUALITY PROTEIN: DNA-binding protein RFX7-like [Uloborus diversus]
MNAVTMKLDSTQHSIPVCNDKPKEIFASKKCKNVRKKSILLSSDKDALLSNHGLGRKSGDIVNNLIDSNKSNNSAESNSCKKVRSKKVISRTNDKMLAKSDSMQERLKQYLSSDVKEKISSILNEIRALTDVEKLFLYLQLPTGASYEVDPLKQKTQNPLGKKADEEGMIAVTWIQSHLEEDPDVSLPKQEVFDEYQSYCHITGTEPLCAADFGKVMKQIFPSVKPRRLGTRGNSRYCYSGLRKKLVLKPPILPDINAEKENCDALEGCETDDVLSASCHLLFEWVEKLLGMKFESLRDLATHLLENMYVDNRSVAAFTVLLDSSPHLLEKGFPNSDGGVKKSEAQIHLQRKIQEKEHIKEQKKKLQEQQSNLVCLNKGKILSSKKKNLKSKKPKSFPLPADIVDFPEDKESEKIICQPESQLQNSNSAEIPVKEEDCELEVIPSTLCESPSKSEIIKEQLSPEKQPSPSQSPGYQQDIEDSTKKKNKVLSHSKTPVCIAQSLSSIIIVPSISHLPEMGKQTLTPQKYKRIQPKPSSNESFSAAVRTRAGSLGSSSIKPKNRSNDGRRSSHAWLQSDSNAEIDDSFSKRSFANISRSISKPAILSRSKKSAVCEQATLKENLEFLSDSLTSSNEEVMQNVSVNEKPNQTATELIMKNNSQEHFVETSVCSEDNNAVKRHLDESGGNIANKRLHLDGNISVNKDNISCNALVQNSLNQRSTSIEEVSVYEIEGDALNDYFRGSNSHTSVFIPTKRESKESEPSNSSNNKVEQLSQLRILLEQNLPRGISKTVKSPKNQMVSSSSPLVSDENVLLSHQMKSINLNSKDLYSTQMQDLNKSVFSNSTLEREINIEPMSDKNADFIKSNMHIDTVEKLLSSSDLNAQVGLSDNEELLSNSNIFLNSTKSDIQMDISSQNGLLDMNKTSDINDSLLASNVISNVELLSQQTNHILHSNRVSTYTQVPSVPQSPNTRRRAFNFMPISPRHTPVPDTACPAVSLLSSPVPNQYPRNMMSTAVGPSQPPSNAGSPFVSPRSTPVSLCRSRHSSGQSTYSASRHTPFQNFDSGVSSVSTSPFISPQPTPVPIGSRLRHNSSHGTGKTVTFCSINSPQIIHSQSAINVGRTRHSSGPGGPHLLGSLYAPRSAPLSPLVSDQCPPSSFMFPSASESRSRHNSGSNTTSLSPLSEQASSSSSSCTSNLPDLSSTTDTVQSLSHSFIKDGAADLLISANPTFKQVRQRHASGSVIYTKPSLIMKDTFSPEVQSLLKNNVAAGTEFMLSNRSQSVPLHQMLQNLDTYCFLPQPVEDSCPTKSHPNTPVMNQMFSFPSLSSTQENPSLILSGDVLNCDKPLVQSSQMEWSGLEPTSDLEMSSARRNLAPLLDGPLSDDLQTTLEDLRDCDTDFSKFAQELELSQTEDGSL